MQIFKISQSFGDSSFTNLKSKDQVSKSKFQTFTKTIDEQGSSFSQLTYVVLNMSKRSNILRWYCTLGINEHRSKFHRILQITGGCWPPFEIKARHEDPIGHITSVTRSHLRATFREFSSEILSRVAVSIQSSRETSVVREIKAKNAESLRWTKTDALKKIEEENERKSQR